MSHKVVTNAPYSADVSNSAVQTLADGNTIMRTTNGRVARDSQGRTYMQETNSGGPFASKGNAFVTFISDPVAGYSYVLNSDTKVAMRRAFKAQTSNESAGEKRHTGPMFDDGSERTESDLGQQTINGMAAQGKSVTRTIAAGAIGNTQPIVEKSEVWTSPDLQIVVLSKRSDPRIGQTTYSVTNIHRGEPSAALFQIPSDYKVEDAPAWRRP
jgi:hypothetical protein